jgi:iron complex transport system substrate-binding protein
MRLKAYTFSLLCLACFLAEATTPQRVVSINLCSDQLLLLLAEPAQVASVSYLALEKSSSFVAEQAAAFPTNRGRLEEIISFNPDLVLTLPHTNSRLTATLKTLGFKTHTVKLGTRLETITLGIEHLAKRLGQQSKGEALIAEMKQAIGDQIEASTPNKPSALVIQPRGYTSGLNTLQDEALKRAGWRNPAAENGVDGYHQVSLEKVILWQPDALLTSPYGPPSDSLAERLLQHPALSQLLGGRPKIEIPYKYWICPGPMLAEAVNRLRDARMELR